MLRVFLFEFVRMPIKQMMLMLEAIFYLLLAQLALRCLPFKCVEFYLNLRPKQPGATVEEKEHHRNSVQWSIGRVGLLLPVKAVCFSRGIAAQAMLRRRRVGATLYYGAMTNADTGELQSHVWVKVGEDAVTGCLAAAGYKIIAQYPENVII